ncbi:SpoIIE family protein phosphatase [Streptomyces halobius]|uniref:SpoIIE family protein phosphatase n=1 Tax=Streptomyces halobius TaxID=2879846 RepID=A0ABY4M9M5_9ACTN|nr:SpoIIE family protein phosphatase [Streptomyces halobius]UQA94102.1 SpoIIE family protein phosphatase [Streptomyces halobius]
MAKLQENRQTGQQAWLNLADAAIFLLDAHGLVESWSPGAERLLGRKGADVVGLPVTALLAADDAARVAALAEECRERGSWTGLLSARGADDAQVGIEAQVVPVTDSTDRAHWLVLAVEASPLQGWQISRAVLERMVTQTPVGMAVVDTDLRFVWSNAALERFGGGPAQNRIGKRLGEIQPGLDAESLEVQMRRVLETGEQLIEYEHIGRPRSDPHRERAHSMSFVRLDDVNGRPIGVCYTVLDITERYQNRQRLTLLDRASQYIGRTLDVMQTAQDLADVAVPHLADFVAVDLLDSVIRGGEPVSGPLSDADMVLLRRAGQQSLREGVPESVVDIGDMATYHAWSPPIRCLAGGGSWRTERLDPLSPEWAANIPGDRHAHFLDLGLHTAMVVPIRARGMSMGVTAFFRSQHDEAFSADDLSLAEEFVARAAVCIDNARRYTRERGAALALQRSLLPHEVPQQDAVRVASSYRPADALADAGGDWFDVIALSGARVALVVGDVTGHGIDAVATMGRLRTAVQTLAALELRPDELLGHLDDLVGRVSDEAATAALRNESAADAPPVAVHLPGADAGVRGSSCLYAVYDPLSRCCTMASAGHPAPAMVAPDGRVHFADLSIGPRLGVGGLPFEAVESVVPEGSVLALYTDGLLTGRVPGEAGDTGTERLRRALETPHVSLDALCETVIESLVPARPFDDVTLLLAATRSLDEDRYASWDLPTDPAVVSRARGMAADQLTDWGLADLVVTTELVVSELVTNAIRYGSGPIRLRLILGHTLTCEVCDGSSTSPYLRHPRATDEGGRGLFLVSQFTHRWGTRYTTDGKILWTEQLLTPNDPDGAEKGPEPSVAGGGGRNP